MDQLPDLDRDAHSEYFYLDYKSRVRFTHFPSGDTCAMQSSNVSSASGRFDWNVKMKAFSARHPNAHLVVSYSHKIVDDLRSHPNTGLSFQVGDDVVVINEDGDLQLHTAVERLPVPADRQYDLLDYDLKLDDGTRLFWDSSDQAWIAEKATPWSRSARARRPLKGEIVQRPPADSEKRQGGRSS